MDRGATVYGSGHDRECDSGMHAHVHAHTHCHRSTVLGKCWTRLRARTHTRTHARAHTHTHTHTTIGAEKMGLMKEARESKNDARSLSQAYNR